MEKKNTTNNNNNNNNDKGENDTIQSIKDIRSEFRLSSAKMLMDMCGDVGDVIQTYAAIDPKSKLKMVECRNKLLSKVESIHENEQKDAEICKKMIRKNKAYRRIRFNEQELKMLEQVVELKNDPNNKLIQTEKEKKKKNIKKKKSFITRAGNEQNHKNYKEFVKSKQEEFDKNKSKIIAQYKNQSMSRQLPPITPRELKNLPDIEEKYKTSKQSQITQKTTSQKLSLSSSQSKQPKLNETLHKDNQSSNDNNINTDKKSLRRFQISGSMTLKSQIKQLRKLKKMKLDDLTASRRNNMNGNYDDGDIIPGQL